MIHGGDIYSRKVNIDFSVNLNPLGTPQEVTEALKGALHRSSCYPDPEQHRARREIAGRISLDEDHVYAGSGASELLLAMVRAVKPKKALIFEPAFSGYEHACRAANCETVRIVLSEDSSFSITKKELAAITPDIDLVFVCDPNNPTGNGIDEDVLTGLIETANKQGAYVCLDESFFLMSDGALAGAGSLWEEAGAKSAFPDRSRLVKKYDNLIIIRSLTKILAIPGIRTGYVAAHPEIIRKIKAQLPEWNLPVLSEEAIVAGLRAIYETDFVRRTIETVQGERTFLSDGLKNLGLTVYDSSTCFLLFKGPEDICERLLQRGILIRDCAGFNGLGKGFYRIAVRSHEDNKELIRVLKSITETPQKLRPDEIEKRSFQIISKELEDSGIILDEGTAFVTKRCIHTSADFDYASTLTFSDGAVDKMKSLIRGGAYIVTDTNMALSGINKKKLAGFGGEALCFMADEDVALEAGKRGITRASASMEKAAGLGRNIIFAIGNAPTALIRLHEMMEEGIYTPKFIIGVPVGFVNVVAAKELFIGGDVPYIINRGRKGGSNIAAAICNAVLYDM